MSAAGAFERLRFAGLLTYAHALRIAELEVLTARYLGCDRSVEAR